MFVAKLQDIWCDIMRIPETSANGPYYGTNENGQWQGVMADAGVSGVVGSGDGYHQHPPAYVQPQPGYMVGPPYYGPGSTYTQPQVSGQQDDFADYMWMENEEEFDKQVMQQLEEEALMEQCIEAMLEDERERERGSVVTNGHNAIASNGLGGLSLAEQVSKSTLNPLAAEFVPTFARTQQPQPSEERRDAIPVVSSESVVSCQNEAVTAAAVEHPEVSAEGVLPIDDTELRSKDRDEPTTLAEESVTVSKNCKTVNDLSLADSKAKKVQESNSSKEQVRTEVKSVKSEEKVLDAEPAVAAESVKMEQQTSEEVASAPAKPINYAAAAKAKVKKSSQTPVAEKQAQKPPQKIQPKTVRKNSNK